MADACSSGLRSGRPYGGVSVYIHNRLACNVKALACNSDRCVAFTIGNVLFAGVYMPCDYRTVEIEHAYAYELGQLQSFIDFGDTYHCVFTGDFNVEFGRPSNLR
ncbi:MAG: hypothetical protein AAF384_09395, partial [Pseudomonadota bacterium]